MNLEGKFWMESALCSGNHSKYRRIGNGIINNVSAKKMYILSRWNVGSIR